jgi:hypothetical protein
LLLCWNPGEEHDNQATMDALEFAADNEVSNKLVWNDAKTIATIGENTTWEITETELV